MRKRCAAFCRLLKNKKEPLSGFAGQRVFSFNGNNIVVDRLTAGEEGELCLGAVFGEDLLGLLGLLLGDILAEEDGDELGMAAGSFLGQFVQKRGDVLVGIEELAAQKTQIVALVDGEAVEEIGRASCRERV